MAGFFERLKNGLTKSREGFVKNFDTSFRGHTEIDEDFYEDLEEIMIMGDLGVKTTSQILAHLEDMVNINHIKQPIKCRDYLVEQLAMEMDLGPAAYEFEKRPSVVLFVGVNGVGKTTSIGKLGAKLKASGKKVMFAAADTFRAAAQEQLQVWADRAGIEMVGGPEGSDPSAVVYEAIDKAKSKGTDVLLIDTAGRLNNKKNLMMELEKIKRIIDKAYPECYRETLVVLDATTGQNALQQAHDFAEITDVSGIVLTKMDGTAKGGIVITIQSELKIPVKYIGVGETIDDLEKFNSKEFLDAMFSQED